MKLKALSIVGACAMLAFLLAGQGATLAEQGTITGASSLTGAGSFTPPPVKHVWIIELENTSYRDSFGTPATDPYLAGVLPTKGAVLRQYYGIGHESLDNYIAQISGQGPTLETQLDCSVFTDFRGAAGGPNGQAVGQGCVYPATVKTLPDQLQAKGLTWKGYMEDMGNNPSADGGTTCAHPAIGAADQSGGAPGDRYATKHNPFVYFHSIIDNRSSCDAHVVPLTALKGDLRSIRTTPNFSFISPNTEHDGHDTGVRAADTWLQGFLPAILGSRAYRRNGLVLITFDEASDPVGQVTDTEDFAACCNEIPGPNSPMPGLQGPGGGRVGALVLSRYVKPGTKSDTPYNHYSLLRSLEDLFRITTGGDDGQGHLGYAGTYATYAGPGSFGSDVYRP